MLIAAQWSMNEHARNEKAGSAATKKPGQLLAQKFKWWKLACCVDKDARLLWESGGDDTSTSVKLVRVCCKLKLDCIEDSCTAEKKSAQACPY